MPKNLIEEQIKGNHCATCQDFTQFKGEPWCSYWNEKTKATDICVQYVKAEKQKVK